MSATWECPSCKRRVPTSIEECRCGWLRSSVPMASPRPDDPARGAQPRGWELWAGVAFGVLLLAWGVYWILRPPAPSPATGILGFVDPTPPPSPSARPR